MKLIVTLFCGQKLLFTILINVVSHRFNATDDDIKRAYRKIVLKHHPDKRKAQGEDVRTDDDYFTCITKAYETLGTYIRHSVI